MGFEPVSKPFLETWLRRTRKQLSGSGRISQLALILARDEPQFSQHEWRSKLQAIYQGDEEPSLELLTQIDSHLAKPSGKWVSEDSEMLLFQS
jgi:hypothetical protein